MSRAATVPARYASAKAAGVTSRVCAVMGAQWGDEGKGKLADVLAKKCVLLPPTIPPPFPSLSRAPLSHSLFPAPPLFIPRARAATTLSPASTAARTLATPSS